MATLYVGGRLFDGEKVQDGQAVLEEGGRIKRVAAAGEFKGFAGERVDTSGGHADSRHHRLPRPFAVGRRGQSRRGAGSR